mmetsp:Transcript_25135/g.55117  ORF Transcript_25135/g.55117 Transcript_25135/m.55117 type:complete len:335 (+) Transcript_25135:184-1188(+)|eukprot:CAMPEP_0168178040 /NCGR_PEP_ID=MMETSP0139_2-20121125/8849_1 /TAXON_ID=44445 /ORGANISM="Pseudo-nitzschia australis, Strain 10249 10 AB" /LENGTH=334 /DNA_ID=CAMNT_0008097279 /DNA_START=201 /DNA_END=1205 /DNA_ORIENTATION=-
MVLRSVCVLAVLCLLANCRFTSSLPMQVTINQRLSECLYEKLNEGESVTVSVFILSGSQLRATYSLEGPIASLEVDSGLELYDKAQEYSNDKRKRKHHLSISKEVDFEHLNDEIDDDDDDDDDDAVDDDHHDDDGPIDPEDPNADDKRRKRRERQRQRFLNLKKKRESKKLKQLKQIRQDGEPIMHTQKAPRDGWYRMCVTASWNLVVAEMEMRKESELGGLDEEGHVRTYEMQKMIEEDNELEEDTAEAEGIKDEDFVDTRDKVKDLRRLLNDIQSMQQKERRRLTVHAETNEHSHSSMVLNSLTETLLFMAVTGYQVYTIRKWFSGAPVLGR